MLVHLAVQLAAALLATAQVIAVAGALPATFDREVRANMHEYALPGVALATVDGEGRADARTFGFADAAHAVPVTAQTQFAVASITKTFTALAVMRLVQDGRVDLDQPADRYLRRWHVPRAENGGDAAGVTVRRLLSHTAGIGPRNTPDYRDASSLIPTLTKVRLLRPPGSRFAYTSFDYAIVQCLIEDVTGKSFAVVLRDSVLVPFGMTHSFVGAPRDIVPWDETGHSVDADAKAVPAAGALVTTLDDMIAFLRAMVVRRGAAVLDARSMALLESPSPESGGIYGLGVFIEQSDDPATPMIGHDGSDTGWMATAQWFPKQRRGIVVLTNGSNGEGVYRRAVCVWAKAVIGVRLPNQCEATHERDVLATLFRAGAPTAHALIAHVRVIDPAFDIPEDYFNFLAYRMMSRGQNRDALTLFEFITAVHPTSSNAFDSLGDGLLANGRRADALVAFRHAVQLDPNNASAKRSAERLTQ